MIYVYRDRYTYINYICVFYGYTKLYYIFILYILIGLYNFDMIGTCLFMLCHATRFWRETEPHLCRHRTDHIPPGSGTKAEQNPARLRRLRRTTLVRLFHTFFHLFPIRKASWFSLRNFTEGSCAPLVSNIQYSLCTSLRKQGKEQAFCPSPESSAAELSPAAWPSFPSPSLA